jgi:hypothetical protein
VFGDGLWSVTHTEEGVWMTLLFSFRTWGYLAIALVWLVLHSHLCRDGLAAPAVQTRTVVNNVACAMN